jgi:mono/diheme cytochrome c family protein
MRSVELRVGAVILVTIVAYTVVANVIPQIESEVPLDVAFGADVTAEELVEAGSVLYAGAGGCTACHAETPCARGPNLITDYRGQGPIGVRCGDRVPGLDCKEYLYQALVQPDAHVVDDFPLIMPPADRALTQPQIWALVAYLQDQGGEVTVTGEDIPADPTAPPAPPPAEPAELAAAPEIFRTECMMCHEVGGQGGPVGPPFDDVGARLSEDEIRTAILDPGATITEGYEAMAGVMPEDYAEQLTGEQIEALVRYLSGLR